MDYPARITLTHPTSNDVHAARLRRSDTRAVTACGTDTPVCGPLPPAGKTPAAVTCPACLNRKETP